MPADTPVASVESHAVGEPRRGLPVRPLSPLRPAAPTRALVSAPARAIAPAPHFAVSPLRPAVPTRTSAPARAIAPAPHFAVSPLRPAVPTRTTAPARAIAPAPQPAISPLRPAATRTTAPARAIAAHRQAAPSRAAGGVRAESPWAPAHSIPSDTEPARIIASHTQPARTAPAHSGATRAVGAAPSRRRHRLPLVGAAVVALATIAGLGLPTLTPALSYPAVPVRSNVGSGLDATRSASPTASPTETPDTITTTYAAGAFATPQTGGMRLVPTAKGPLTGKVIVVDPGHNGKYKRSINERTYFTYGAGWRPCVQGGTTTYTGVTESEITWAIANKVVPHLLAKGATVVVTRANNEGYGPCNNERPEIANREGASLFLSLHVDGNETTSLRGFYVAHSTRMLGGEAVQEASAEAAQIFARTIMEMTGHPGSNYVGEEGDPTYVRTDLAVLDGVRVAPAILIESGNSRNPEDVAFLTEPDSQEAYARALAAAAEEVVLSLPANPSAGPASASPSAPPGATRPPVTTTASPTVDLPASTSTATASGLPGASPSP